ncbi:aminodeoxychorismate lyase [Methylotenera sp.]|jgi:4-amino-4-deoxychorismate lyase|uniref:aminodeoxychorismate lyase n=1 Tax=Methylotenera sp. TaxID=2051956 RepID=UPI002731BFC6|nr:aminodeoxychorismate lyase [Methylotenera sp.]MDP2071543.1 aminodeoxychorismate lyase [Methylotenera sp.]MDP3004934.1 aminodeoxychorismate lyase [Methylotenera sp.]MDZ4210828.1 aminodeoxychorismate lyase [Methylotenera sp.]
MNSAHSYIINGDFNQVITPLDRGFAYGDGVFRTMLMRNGQPECWPLHYQKLVADCAAIGIVCPSAELLMNDMQQLISIKELTDNLSSVIKVIITRGEGERGYAVPAVTNPTRVIVKSAMPSYAKENFVIGVNLHVCKTRLAVQTKLAGIKHLNRLENVMARMEWHDENIFDGVMLDQYENVIECTMSNIFARFDKVLVTPDLSQCGVAGMTRQRIMGLVSSLNLTVEVEALPLIKLTQADEVIICNSLYGAFQVSKIGQNTWSLQSLAKNIRNLLSS